MFSCTVDENLKLVLPRPHRVEEMTAVVRENLEELKLWMPWATDEYSIETAKEFVKNVLVEFAENRGFSANIELDGKIVGTIGFHNLDDVNKSVHMGYWLDKAAQGKGLVTRSCRVFIDYAFDELGLNRVQINCNVENKKSRAVPERLGFQLEGIHRQVEVLNGRFGDWAIYAMLKEDWENI